MLRVFIIFCVAIMPAALHADDFGGAFGNTAYDAFHDTTMTTMPDDQVDEGIKNVEENALIEILNDITPAAGDPMTADGDLPPGYSRTRRKQDAHYTRRVRGSTDRIERLQAEPFGSSYDTN